MSRTVKKAGPAQNQARPIRPKGLDRPVDFDLSESLSDSDEELSSSRRQERKPALATKTRKRTSKEFINEKDKKTVLESISDDDSEELSVKRSNKAAGKKKVSSTPSPRAKKTRKGAPSRTSEEDFSDEEVLSEASDEENIDNNKEEPETAVDRIIGFTHHLTPAKGVITTAKFQPTRVIKKVNLPTTKKQKTVPKKERERMGLIDRGFLVSNISTGRGIDENLRNEIEHMGFAKVKALKRPALNRYYRMLEPGKGDAPSFSSNSEFAKFIFRRLGLSVDEKA
jgi:hypothetical protein